jgi:spoIIIJ-associated protein
MTDEIVEETMTTLEKQAEVGADFVEGFLDIAELNGDIESGVRDNRPFVDIVYDKENENEANYLIGKHGSVMNSLQQLTRLAILKQTNERSKLALDVAGYQEKQKAHIIEIAKKGIDDLSASGDSEIELRPMNSYDRRLIHNYALEQGYNTDSRGAEPERFVVIFNK